MMKAIKISFLRKKTIVASNESSNSCCDLSGDCPSSLMRYLGWASVAVSVAALGVFAGKELRQRYKFKRRTPSDFYSHAGDELPTEYGMGI